MNLRHKTTGEVFKGVYIRECHDSRGETCLAVYTNPKAMVIKRVSSLYRTLSEINDEWEDAADADWPERWEQEGIKSKLTGLIIAPEDVTKEVAGGIGTECDGKMYFTWDEAMKLEKELPGGWRLPTRSEWALLAEEFGQDESGTLNGPSIKRALNLLPAGELWSGGIVQPTSSGFWWSRTPDPVKNHWAYLLRVFSNDEVYTHFVDQKRCGAPVRLVKEINKVKEIKQ